MKIEFNKILFKERKIPLLDSILEENYIKTRKRELRKQYREGEDRFLFQSTLVATKCRFVPHMYNSATVSENYNVQLEDTNVFVNNEDIIDR